MAKGTRQRPLDIANTRVGAAILALALTLLWPGTAQAHAFLLSTTPASGARLASAPSRISLTFDEAVTPAQGGIELRRLGGGQAPTVGKAITTDGGKTLQIGVGHLQPGVYEASWQIIADDGHFEAGELDFQVGHSGRLPTLTGGPRTPLPWSLVWARLLIYVGLALTFGRVLIGLRVGLRSQGLTMLGIVLMIVGAFWQQLALAAEVGGGALWTGVEATHMHAALQTQAGKLGAAMTVVAVLQILILVLAKRGTWLLIGSGALIIVLLALSGHSDYARYTPLTVTLDAVHIAAAAIWLGGVTELGYVALADREQLWRRARRFAPLGFAAAGTLAATGIYSAWIHVGHWSALTGTPYGRTVLVKSGLFFAALGLGAFNHLTTRHGHSRWGSITLEPGVLAMLVAVAAVLVNVAPPPPTAQAAAAPSLSAAAPLAGAEINLAAPAGHTIIAIAASPRRLQVSAIAYNDKPASDAHLAVQHDPALHFAHCGSACLTAPWNPTQGRQRVSVLVSEHGVQRRVDFDLHWPPGRDQSTLLDTAIRNMTRLRSVHLQEVVSSGFGGSPASTRGVYQPGHALRLVGDNGFGLVTIGNTSWQRAPNGQSWQRLPKPQRINLFGNYAQEGATNVRALEMTRLDGRGVVVLGYWVPGQRYWYRLWIDPARRLILRDQIITPGHYLTDRYHDFNKPARIRPPTIASP